MLLPWLYESMESTDLDGLVCGVLLSVWLALIDRELALARRIGVWVEQAI